jgi:hypothetical protein
MAPLCAEFFAIDHSSCTDRPGWLREFNAVSVGGASQRFTDELRVVSSLNPRGFAADKH